MFETYARLLLRYRWAFALAGLGVTLFFALPMIPLRNIRFDFSPNRLFRVDNVDASTLTRFKNMFGDDAGTAGVLYVAQRPGALGRPAVLSPSIALAIADMESWLNGRKELDPDFTLSPLSATDFFSEPVQGSALSIVLERDLRSIVDLEQASQAWASSLPLPQTLVEWEKVAKRLASHELYSGMILSKDGFAAAVVFRFNLAHNDPNTRKQFVADISERIEEQRTRLAGQAELHLFGLPVVTEEYARLSIKDIVRTAPLSLLIMTLFLFIFFRSVAAALLPQFVVGIAVVWAVGFMQMTDEPFNMINHVVPVMVLIIGVADAVHLLSRYGEERRLGFDTQRAIRKAVTMLSKACFLTSATTAIGFMSLGTAKIATIASFGLYTGVAVMLTYVANMTLLPIGLSFSRKAPSKPLSRVGMTAILESVGRFAVRNAKPIFVIMVIASAAATVCVAAGLGVNNLLLEEVPPSNPVYQATKTMENRLSPVIPHEVLITGKAMLGSSCASDGDCPSGMTCVTAGQTRAAISPIRDAFAMLVEPEDLALIDSLEERINRDLPPRTGACVESVKNPKLLQALDRIGTSLLSDPVAGQHVGRVESLALVVRQMNQAIHRGHSSADRVPDSWEAVAQLLIPLESAAQELLDRYATLDYDATRMTLLLKDHGSSAWHEVKDRLDELLNEHIASEPKLAGRFEYVITGSMTFVEKAVACIVRDMLLSICTAFVFIFLLMMLLFRSVRMGLLSILPNIFPLIATLFLMTVTGVTLRTATVIIFSVSLGIAVNDTIHLIARFNEEIVKGRERDDAIVAAMRSSGKAMTTSSLILVGGFMVDIISEFVALTQFAWLASFTMVMALVGDLVVLPACLALFAGRPFIKSMRKNEGAVAP